MQTKRKQVYVQQHIFDDDEVITVTSRQASLRYDDYIQGARDMLLLCLSALHRSSVRNMPRIYMRALLQAMLTDKTLFQRFAAGEKFRFSTQRDSSGNILSVQIRVKKLKQ